MPLKKTESVIVLGVDSNYEEVTEVAEKYRSKHVYPEFRMQGAEVRRLAGSTASRADFVRETDKPGIDYITGVGHGNYSTYTGHHGNAVLRVGAYSSYEVKDKIIHLLSCQTARYLGPDTVKNGAVAFLGYIENFVFEMDCCEEFFDCDSQIDHILAKGGTVGESHDACIEKFNFFIDKYAQSGDYRLASVFEMDRDRLRSPVISGDYGNPDATLGSDSVPPLQYYRVQVGAFKMQENAERKKAELNERGFDAYVILYDGLYRVQCGAFEIMEYAIALKQKLEEAGYQTIIKLY